MLKRIRVEDLQMGMYIHAFCGAWLDHPFWRTNFLLTDTQDLQRIRASVVQEVWIDADRGIDVSAPQEPAAALAIPVTPSAAPQVERVVPMAQELNRAAAICKTAASAVRSMFQDARMGRAIDQAIAHQVVAEIADSLARNGGALISLARLKTADDYSYMHSVAVCALMVALARQLGMDDAQCRAAGFAGLLHDLGKMDIPLAVLNKPGPLTDSEFEIVRQHPRLGHERLLASGMVDEVALDVCLHHHEKIDGSGYPDRLAGDSIGLFARMGAICDVYDATTSNRPYKQGWNPAESIKRMASWKGHFDTALFQAFVHSLGIYPVGSLVMLSSGRLAVVVEQSASSLLKPVVKTVFSTKAGERVVPERLDLSQPQCRHTIVGVEDPQKWKIPDLDDIWSGLRLAR